MLRSTLVVCAILAFYAVNAQQTRYNIPDTMKAIGFTNEITIQPGTDPASNAYIAAGFSKATIVFRKTGKERIIALQLTDTSSLAGILAAGDSVAKKGASFEWKYPWKTGVTYKTWFTALPDSATHTTIYAGYVFLPEKQRWKMLAAFKAGQDGDFIRAPYSDNRNMGIGMRTDTARIGNTWLQRSNGSWYEYRSQRPVVDLAKNYDSIVQAAKDIKEINEAVKNKKIDTTGSKKGVYYYIVKQGTGEQVAVEDTVTVFYKGYLLSDDSVFDQTKEKPATFPLKRLIAGWQVAIPMCRVGGTIRIFIPSGQAYGIRARSKDIPPNSVLVFDIDVVSVKKPG